MAFVDTRHVIARTDDGTGHAASHNAAVGVMCSKAEKLQALLGAIAPGKDVHYVSDAAWNLHDLVLSLARQYAPVNIYLTTYALRETPIRQLVLAMHSQIITELHMLLDYRAQVRTPEVYQLANGIGTSVGVAALHAKVCVLQGPNCNIAIVGSANWTTNPKVEAGVVSWHEDTANFHRDWIMKKIQHNEFK